VTREEALKVLKVLPQLLLADVVTLEALVKAGEFREARRLARRLGRTRL